MAKDNPPIDLIRKAVVDTGPLFNVLVLNFVGPSQTPPYSGFENALTDYLRYDFPAQRKLLGLFDSIQEILITSHVVGELTGLHNARTKLPLGEFWLSSVKYLARKKVDERLLRLVEICDSDEGLKSVSEIGPTDSGLINLARREQCVLLTDDDKTLARRAWNMGLGDQCKLVRNLL